MLTRRELERAIRECEASQGTYQNCQKLATFYTIYDHLYSFPDRPAQEAESVIGEYGDTDFLSAVAGKDAEKTWKVMDELMEALRILNTRLYDSAMKKLAD